MAKPLLLAVVTLILAGCGSSGITVPRLGNRTLEQGYALVRSKGFRISVVNGGTRFSTFGISTLNGLGVQQTVPAAGTKVAPGSIVTLIPIRSTSGDPVSPIHPRYYRLPEFIGRSPGVAMRWADRHNAYWNIPRLPQLHAATARRFFDAYVVTAQRPAAGARFPEGGYLELTTRPRR